MEKNRVLSQSLNHSPSLFDAPGTEACTSEHIQIPTITEMLAAELCWHMV